MQPIEDSKIWTWLYSRIASIALLEPCHSDLLHALRNFRQLRYHIQQLGPAVDPVMVFPHKQIIRAHMKVTGHGYDQIDGRFSLAAFHLAEMLQTDVQRFGHFLLGHAPCLAERT